MCVGICSWLFEHQAIQTHFILGASQTKVLLSLRPAAVPLRQERVGPHALPTTSWQICDAPECLLKMTYFVIFIAIILTAVWV